MVKSAAKEEGLGRPALGENRARVDACLGFRSNRHDILPLSRKLLSLLTCMRMLSLLNKALFTVEVPLIALD